MSRDPRGLHLATVAFGGRIWDAYVELVDDPHRPESYRARLRFDAPDGSRADSAYCTGVILIEHSWEEIVARARAFDERQLQGLLRSVLPDTPEYPREEDVV